MKLTDIPVIVYDVETIWDGDGNLKDQSFNDLPHFELVAGSP